MIDWWSETDGEILDCLTRGGPMTPAEIGAQVRLSEGETITFLTRLAREGKVRIALAELGGEAASRLSRRAPPRPRPEADCRAARPAAGPSGRRA